MSDFPTGRYQIIYADPPWQFRNYSDKWHEQNPDSKWVGKQYNLLSLPDVCNLPIKDISDDNAVLFLWATYPHLPDAFKVIEAWGFTYKTVAFTWVKKNKSGSGIFTGMGFWTRSNAEICLLATKGKILKRQSKSVRQIILTARQEHSRKPQEARERIVELLGDLPRIELFARQRAEGWDGWGLEYDTGTQEKDK